MKKLFFLLSLLLFTLLSFSQSRYISATTKKIVFNRDAGMCKCCGSALNLEYDHVIPFSCGGSSTPSNIQLLCQKCNRSKSNGCYCKIHNNKVGYNCCDVTPATNSRRSSSGTAMQCSGTTKKGLRCRNMTTNSNSRCHLH
jgi:hypothetical protein